MELTFTFLSRSERVPKLGNSTAYLEIDRWNDYSFTTMFYLSLHDETGKYIKIGNVKIGFIGQTTSISTYDSIKQDFKKLSQKYFSLGTELEYYKKIATLSSACKKNLLTSLRDIVGNDKTIEKLAEEDVFKTSLLRDVSLSTIKGQFYRVLNGDVPLTDFKFEYRREETARKAGAKLDFKVIANSKPSTNIHALIGRNGVGKTTLLNDMIESITENPIDEDGFYSSGPWSAARIESDFFSSLISVSFSAFDPFAPPDEQPNPAKGTCYYYIGLRQPDNTDDNLKNLSELHSEFVEALKLCMSQPGKKKRWTSAIQALESDDNFAEMNLSQLAEAPKTKLEKRALDFIRKTSSGHTIVLLIMTKLVATVEEKTLVIIDEPESHLHPPLLSAFIRALSELLHDQNGVAIIATHSPVVLQEIPKSCVWKIIRSRLALSSIRLDIQTFGENVGTLTREVFGLEVSRSGFHSMLEKSVESGKSFQEILNEYQQQLGFEAQGILRSMIQHRDHG